MSLDSKNASAAFSDENAGEGKTVTFSGYALVGDDAANYTLTQPASVTAAITRATSAMTLAEDSITGTGDTRTVTLTATVSGVSGGAVPTGSIEFKVTQDGLIGNQFYATATINPTGKATVTWDGAKHDTTYTVTASYGGDTNTEMGETTYTAAFAEIWAQPQTKAVENVPALGHSWGEVTYTWTDDGSSCTAMRVCQNDETHVETAAATVTGEQTKAPTCTEVGETTYTAAFAEAWAQSDPAQTRTVADIAANGHTFGSEWKSDETNHWHECSCGEKSDVTAHTATTVNAKEATTSEKGYTGDTICGICGYVISRGEEIPLKAQASGTDTSGTGKQDSAVKVTPQTGDASNLALYVVMMLMALAAMICLVVARSRKQSKNQ